MAPSCLRFGDDTSVGAGGTSGTSVSRDGLRLPELSLPGGAVGGGGGLVGVRLLLLLPLGFFFVWLASIGAGGVRGRSSLSTIFDLLLGVDGGGVDGGGGLLPNHWTNKFIDLVFVSGNSCL